MKSFVICAAAAIAVFATGAQAAIRADAPATGGADLSAFFLNLDSVAPETAPVEEARRGRGKDDGPGHIRHGRGADDPVGHA